MMKRFILFVSLMFVASVAEASIYVNWTSTGGYAWSGAVANGLVPENSGQSVLFQLIWSQNNTADAAFATTTDYVSGDDVLLTSTIITETGGGSFDYFFYGLTLNSGYDDRGDDYQTTYGVDGFIYGRVFQSFSPESTPSVNDWYYSGPVVAASNVDFSGTPPTAQTYDMTTVGEEIYSGVDINYIDGAYGAQIQPVPEPGTMALFALGLATLGASRRRRKVQA